MLTPAPSWLIERPITHRALHDRTKGRAENSWSAFQAAIDAGYAIECDLQVTKTGESVVFHDPDLERMTGATDTVRSQTPQQLSKHKLLDTNDTIHTLSEHLEQVAGRVPLVLELKGVEGEDAGFVEGVAKALEGYDGQVAVMSFDHWICAQFADRMPNTPRGLTAYGGADTTQIHREAMDTFDLQFVSYNVKELPSTFVNDMRSLGLPVITWTVRTPEQVEATFAHADQMTFEGFTPPNTLNRNNHG
ncbi:glycerophosphodiester phosphodiesterase family protein [Pseudahrensia aquimaris]|uniref:Glycerophosphodiester phosphodiesterase family protein n=1 Tax=Pseudahrensia aquimaris TaxID=744461 RepID=A0ABW3FJU8_9HYPH